MINPANIGAKICDKIAMNPVADSIIPEKSGAIHSEAVNAPATMPPANIPKSNKIVRVIIGGVVQSTKIINKIRQIAQPNVAKNIKC